MTVPDFRHGFLRIPLSVWLQVFCRAPLTRRQLQIVALVIRESWGWQTSEGGVRLWTRPLTVRQIAAGTGLSTDHLRQDLHRLLANGVLREDQGQYHFIADPRLWTTHASRPHFSRQTAQKSHAPAAKTAPLAPVLKKEKERERNVSPAPDRELSTGGENSDLQLTFSGAIRVRSVVVRVAPVLQQRFLAVVAAFAGPLSRDEAARVRQWSHSAGIARVWRSLEQAHRQGPAAVRRWLHGTAHPDAQAFTDMPNTSVPHDEP